MADTTHAGEQIGSVISLTGSVWAVSGTSQRPLTEGAPVYEGEEIVTESDSNVEVKFADNTILGQGEDSVVRLDDYAYSEDANQLDFQMVKGVMRVVSGEIVKINPEAFNLTTPLATIGIRGTQVMIQVDEGREIIGVDELGEGHTVIVKNAFNEVVIDKAGMFSGVDFDGSLIAPDEMPDNFIQSMVRAAPLTILGDAPRNPGDSQEITPPTFYETIDNQSGEYQPGVGMEYAEGDYEEDYDEGSEEDYELSEAEIEALLELETAAGPGGEAEGLDPVVNLDYKEFTNTPASNRGDPSPQVQTPTGPGGGTGGGDDDGVVPDEAGATPPPVENLTAEQDTTAENEPVSFNVLENAPEGSTLVDADLSEESDNAGDVEFEADGTITYTPEEGEEGTVLIDYTVEDTEGNESSAHLSIELAPDSEPTIIEASDATGEVTDGVMTASGTINVDFGADAEGSSIVLDADDASWDAETETLTALDNSWSAQIVPDGYLFTQYSALTAAADTDPGDDVTVDITINAIDSDGDVASGTVTVTLTDDGPTATDVSLSQETENSDISYNVISEGEATTGLYGGTLISAVLAEDSTAEGQLDFDADGTITYEPAPGETGTIVVDYTVADADNDQASARMTIELADDSAPEITLTAEVTGDESAGLTTVSGTIDVDFGADTTGAYIELASDVADWDGENQILMAEDNSWKIELTDTGYEFTQLEAFDHSDGDDYLIDVTVKAVDGDNTIATGEFSVIVSDDGPTADDAYMTQDEPDDDLTYNIFTEGDATTGLDGGSLIAAELSAGSSFTGEVGYDSDGTITYTPADGETGTVLIDYLVQDGDGDMASAQLSIELAESDEPEEPTNLLVNGDFSDVTANIRGGWAAANASSVDGWDAGRFYNSNSEAARNFKTGGGNAKIEVWKAGFKGVLDPDGTDNGYFVEIDYAGATDYIAQTVATQAGVGYVMTFDATIRPDSPEGETLVVQVWSGDTLITEEVYTPDRYDTSEQEGWTQFTLEFEADSDETTVMFTEPEFHDEGNAKNTYGVLLDNVNLTVDPEYVGEDGAGEDDTDEVDNGSGELGFLFGTDGNDVIEGTQHSDTIFGGKGDDSIQGAQSMDVISGEEGNDVIDGGQSIDRLYGGDGNDTINGGQGSDVLVGGSGADELTGGQGNDTFVFTSPEDGQDLILDFKTAQDQIAMYEATFDLSSDGSGSLAENQFATVDEASYSGGHDFEGASSGLIYASAEGSNTGALFYDPNDTVDGDETLLATITEDGGDIDADDINII